MQATSTHGMLAWTYYDVAVTLLRMHRTADLPVKDTSLMFVRNHATHVQMHSNANFTVHTLHVHHVSAV